MALRTFSDKDGVRWNAWHVIPSGLGGGSSYPSRFRDGWVCFERLTGGGRCRLPLSEIPDDWESLPDERLDLLRKIAESNPATGTVEMHRRGG